jgi:hypothetical protein
MQDHRRSPRYRICQMIRLDFGREGLINAETLNYSAGGLLCRTHETLPLGTKLGVMLAMEEGGVQIPLQVEARVVRLIDTEGTDRLVALELVEPTEEGSRKMVRLFANTSATCQDE